MAAIGRSTTAGRAPVNACISSAQPNGVAQRSHAAPEDVSAATRSTKVAARAAVASPVAWRRVAATWLASAPMPANTAPTPRIASAR